MQEYINRIFKLIKRDKSRHLRDKTLFIIASLTQDIGRDDF